MCHCAKSGNILVIIIKTVLNYGGNILANAIKPALICDGNILDIALKTALTVVTVYFALPYHLSKSVLKCYL